MKSRNKRVKFVRYRSLVRSAATAPKRDFYGKWLMLFTIANLYKLHTAQ